MFYVLRFKKIKKKVGPKWCWVNTNLYANILFKNHVTNRVTKHLFMRKDITLTRVCLVKYLSKYMFCQTSDLKANLITFETLLWGVCLGWSYRVLYLKVEIYFFLTLILFSIVAIGKEFCTTQNFLQPK